jgi:hypothetical protein
VQTDAGHPGTAPNESGKYPAANRLKRYQPFARRLLLARSPARAAPAIAIRKS